MVDTLYERAVDILEQLPIGETFNWVQDVSIEFTARMLTTIFGFPYEERPKLVRWSDLATAVPEVTGDTSIDMGKRYEELMGAATAFYQLWAKRAQSEGSRTSRCDFILSEGVRLMHSCTDQH